MPERTTHGGLAARLPRLTLPELWACLAVLLPVLGALLASISTVDLAYHLRAGAILLDSRTLPSPDTFTFTAAGQPWLDQQWAAQLVFETVDRLGGWAALAIVRAGLVGLVAWLVFRGCRAAGAGTRTAAWLTLAGYVVGLSTLGMRPQLIGMALFAATLAILAGRTARPALVWLIPLLVLAWANVHGSFFLGPAAVVIAWLEDLVTGRPGRTRLLAVAAASAVATLVNPYGLGVWGYALGVAANPTIRRLITEWQPTVPLSYAGAVFYASVVGVLVLVAVLLRRAPDREAVGRLLSRAWPTLAWLGGLALLGGYAERGIAWWSVAFPIAVAGLLAVGGPATVPGESGGAAGANGSRPATRSLLPTVIVSALVVAIVVALPVWRGGDSRDGPTGLLTDAPGSLTDAALVAARPGDRIWTAQRWGSWFEYALPDNPVAVDSRIELIPPDAWADHLALSSASPGWQAILDRRNVAVVVAAADEQARLIAAMRTSPSWRVLAETEDGVVFARSSRP